jgi:hypothetical protein
MFVPWSDRRPVEVPTPEAVLLATELESFGPDSDMRRARELGARIWEAIARVSRGQQARIALSDPERQDVYLALDRMTGKLPDPLYELRLECEPGLDALPG